MARIDAALIERLDGELQNDLRDDGRLGLVRRYLRGDHDDPYMPKGAKAEYKRLAKEAVTNWTPLIGDTYKKGLFVDGFRPAKASDNSEAWEWWQANGLDARQTVAVGGAIDYGASYTLILPGTLQSRRIPVMRPLSPLKSLAYYADEDDEFPEIGFRIVGTTFDGTLLREAYDRDRVYTFAKPKDSSLWVLSGEAEHPLGVTPFVRFRERLDDESVGIIRPLIPLQNRINDIVFSTLIAIQYAAFRQRWATGLDIPEDEDGNPVEPFKAAVDRLWVAEDDKVKFGDFAQTDTSGHRDAYMSTVRSMAAIAQVSPNILTGDLVNLSADALAQLESSTQRKIGTYETLFGESWESAFRLAGRAAGNSTVANDHDSQVRWRDTEARSMAQTVDALGKLATMLEVPVEALWDLIPGITDADVTHWKEMRKDDPIKSLVDGIARQTVPNAVTGPAAPEAPPAKAA